MLGAGHEEGLTINAAAEMCGVSRDTVKRRLASGAFPNAIRVQGPGPRGPWRIPELDLRAAGLLSERPAPDGDLEPAELRLQLAIARTQVQEMSRQLSDLRSIACVAGCRLHHP